MFGSDYVDLDNLADKSQENPCLIANDIDVYHVKLVEEELTIHFKEVKYQQVAGVDFYFNTIPCSALSKNSLIQNNDLNTTAV